MGSLNDKMTELADAIREKALIVHVPGITENLLSIDKMIQVVNEDIYAPKDISSLDAEPSDVSIGKKFISWTGDIDTGTMPDTAAVLDGNTVTVPAGRIRTEQTLTLPSGLVSIDGRKVTVGKGYIAEDTTLTIPEGNVYVNHLGYVVVEAGYLEDRNIYINRGSVTIDGPTVSVEDGYIEEQTLTVQSGSAVVEGPSVKITEGYLTETTLTVQSGSVTISEDKTKVIVEEGYVQSEEIPIPGSDPFGLAKVTEYIPYRADLTAPRKIVVSGIGTIGSVEDDWYTDGSDANGTYVVTEDTKYKTGYARVYARDGGIYYLAGYDSSAAEWPEYNSHWFIGRSPTSYGGGALLYCEGTDIPSGENTWQNSEYGSATVKTEITSIKYPGQSLVLRGQKVNSYDETTGQWSCAESSTALSGCENPPEISQIFAIQNNRTIGNYIDWAGAFADECDERTLVYIPCDELKLRDRSVHRRTVNRLGDESHIALEKGVFGNCWQMVGEYPGGLCYVDIPEFDVNADWCLEMYYLGADSYFAYLGSIGFTITTDYFGISGTRVIINDPLDGSFPVNKQLVHLAVQYNSQLKRIECFANGQMRTITEEGNEFIWENLPQAKKIIMGLDWTSQGGVHRWDEFRLHQYRKYTGDFTPPGFEEK